MIKILNIKDSNFEDEFNRILRRGQEDMDSIIPQVWETLQDIKRRGLDAILELVRKYDGWSPKCEGCLKLDFNVAEDAFKRLDSSLKDSLQIAYERIYTYHDNAKTRGFMQSDGLDNLLGQVIQPVQRAGIYIPGGKAFYPSSLLMNAIPARVAGVREIVMTTPVPRNEVSDLLLAVMYLCDVREGYKVGGVGAIGLLAYGAGGYTGGRRWRMSDLDFGVLESGGLDSEFGIKKVDVITGPGNIYVATAKKLVFGEVGIDMIAGPSEVGIIAEAGVPLETLAETLAIDMLAQAEHDEMASSILITPDSHLALSVSKDIESKLEKLERSHIARASIDNRGAIIVVENLAQAVCLMNEIAPEHLEIITQNPLEMLPRIKATGAIFLGRYTPEAVGDYLAGPNHTLPTGGSARFFSPLSADNFSTRSSVLSFSKQGLESLRPHCLNLARIEGLEAHGMSVVGR